MEEELHSNPSSSCSRGRNPRTAPARTPRRRSQEVSFSKANVLGSACEKFLRRGKLLVAFPRLRFQWPGIQGVSRIVCDDLNKKNKREREKRKLCVCVREREGGNRERKEHEDSENFARFFRHTLFFYFYLFQWAIDRQTLFYLDILEDKGRWTRGAWWHKWRKEREWGWTTLQSMSVRGRNSCWN